MTRYLVPCRYHLLHQPWYIGERLKIHLSISDLFLNNLPLLLKENHLLQLRYRLHEPLYIDVVETFSKLAPKLIQGLKSVPVLPFIRISVCQMYVVKITHVDMDSFYNWK